MTDAPKARRGFAAMSAEKRSAIAALGGKAVPAHKRSFATQDGLASSAGAAGGAAPRAAKAKSDG